MSDSLDSRDFTPVVSIVMGAYNASVTVDEAIESICQQTYANWELIICDDGSTDTTWHALQRWKSHLGPQLVLLRNEVNCGLSFSLNRGLAVAQGKYIARMDADDRSHANRLERQVAFLDQNGGLGVVGTAMQRFDSSGPKRDIVKPPLRVNAQTLPRAVPFCHATIMARRSVFLKTRYSENPKVLRVEDIDLWYRLFRSGSTGSNLWDVLYFVREDSGSIKRRTLQNRYNLLRVHLTELKRDKRPFYVSIWPLMAFAKAALPNGVFRLHRRLREIKA